MTNNQKMQWLFMPIVLTWLLYAFLTMQPNPFYWTIGCRFLSVLTLLFLYWIFARILFSEYKKSKNSDGWISVDERLPEINKSVNVKLANGAYTHSFIDNDGFWAYIIEPTHWRNKNH